MILRQQKALLSGTPPVGKVPGPDIFQAVGDWMSELVPQRPSPLAAPELNQQPGCQVRGSSAT